MEEIIYENFNISENNIISVELVKVVRLFKDQIASFDIKSQLSKNQQITSFDIESQLSKNHIPIYYNKRSNNQF